MLRFSHFDARGYRTVDVRTGYGAWVPTYERTVEDAMDIALLDELTAVPWQAMRTVADLGCGTGRTGAWLRRQGAGEIDGVDLTPAMLELARSKGVYRRLVENDLATTGLEAGAYNLVASCLVDEHLPDLQPLYREAWRLSTSGGWFVLVGFHPHFIMVSGMPTHFTSESGEPIAIDTHVHLISDHVAAAVEAGWVLAEMKEQLIDDAWLDLKPKWEQYEHHPIALAFVWHKPN
ncbi:MAG: class I SAM-dependent methyltransferase [Dehalococcoidia bacterium]